jgi:hypothetical protein
MDVSWRALKTSVNYGCFNDASNYAHNPHIAPNIKILPMFCCSCCSAARFLLAKTTPRPYAPRGPAATVTAQASITKPVKIFLDLNV